MAPFLSSKEKDRRANVRLANVRRSDIQPLLVAEHSYAKNVSDEPDDPGPDSSDQDSSWRVGRRIVELDVLAKGLEGCSQCGTPLALTNTTRETRFGLGSSLHILCTTCTCINKVPLGKKHKDANKKQTVWDINSKVAIGMLHIGIGETQLNNLLSVLNLPSINRNSLKKREREVGKSIEQVAKLSIRTALEREIEITKNDTNTETDGPVHLTGSVDAAWQSRGSGRSYNSLSGHASMIGAKTGKIIGLQIRSKNCRICSKAKERCIPARVHSCRKNWSGSSKAMEGDMIVHITKNIESEKACIRTVVGDEDATTISKLHKEISPDIEKRSDSNHLRKILGNELFTIKQTNQISAKTIKYLQKNFNYMCQQNKQNPEGIRQGLDALSMHPFNDHSKCDEAWCKHVKNPSIKFNSLPYGKPLTDKKFKSSLQNIFEKYKKQADKLAFASSTQSNENFNNIVASKAPKNHHTSGSESLDYRVNAAASQKNTGYTYLVDVNKEACLSPGAHTKLRAMKLDAINNRRRQKGTLKTYKRRRLELKSQRNSTTAACELREGDTYSTNIAFEEASPDVEEIPGPIDPPLASPVTGDHPQVVFDLETTGLGRNSHITQLAAVGPQGIFNRFVRPKVSIQSEASAVTGIRIIQGDMYCRDEKVSPVNITQALQEFHYYLSLAGSPVILTGHNIKIFDCPVLLNAASSCGIELDKCIAGFLDTLPLFREAFPGLKCYKQDGLYHHFLGGTFNAHDAREDVASLKKLLDAKCPKNVLNHTFDIEYIKEKQCHSRRTKQNLATWEPAIRNKAISKGMAEKASSSGLQLEHARLSYTRQGICGLESVFSERTPAGNIRVTKTKTIIQKLAEYFE